MKVRYQADADLNRHIVLATLRLEPSLDFHTAVDANLDGLPDQEVLARSADSGSVLVTHDGRTMPREFAEFLQNDDSAGALIVPQHLPVATVAEELLLIWLAMTSDEWVNRIAWLPL